MASELLDIGTGLGPVFSSIAVLVSTTALVYKNTKDDKDWRKNPESRLYIVLLIVSLFNTFYISWRDRELFKSEMDKQKTRYQLTYLIVVSVMIIIALEPL